jgi:hypothetical protein
MASEISSLPNPPQQLFVLSGLLALNDASRANAGCYAGNALYMRR